MSIVKMQSIEICALMTQRKKLLEYIQRRGVMEVADADCDELKTVDTSGALSVFKNNTHTIEAALEILTRACPETKGGLLSSFKGRKAVPQSEYDSFYGDINSTIKTAKDIIAADRSVSEEKALRVKNASLIGALTPYASLDLSMVNSQSGASLYAVGAFPPKTTLDMILAAFHDDTPVHAEILSDNKDQTCAFILYRKKDREKVEDILRKNSFIYPGFITDVPPCDRIEALKKESAESLKREAENKARIKEYAKDIDKLRFALDHFAMRSEKYRVIANLAVTDHAFFLKGYIPYDKAERFKADIEKRFTAAVEISEADDNAPVLTRNNGFSAPVETVLSAYGLPGKGDIDPTGIMSIFYYILFGIMFSDAGYGALMALVCGILWIIYRKSDAPIMKSVKMFFFCGVSTLIWGLILGSFFGDALEVISQNFLNRDWHTPCLWFAPLKDPMKMLLFTMLIGLIHMFTGLGIAAYQCIRDRRWLDLFADVIAWVVMLVALIFMLMGSGIYEGIAGWKLTYTSTQSMIINIAAIAGAVFIVLTAGRESKNILKRLMKGLYGLYGATGWLGDVISYSRLLALGLATGVVGSVINQMGAMIGNPVAFAFVFIIGHLLNFLINVLGAYVHTNRLQFVEFFGKFYSGGGREFVPFDSNTKYYSVKEDK